MNPDLIYLVARAEHREWERRFNERAARGEFVKHELPGSDRGLPLIARLRDRLLAIRSEVSRYIVRGQLSRA
jgi:hypothetical protein